MVSTAVIHEITRIPTHLLMLEWWSWPCWLTHSGQFTQRLQWCRNEFESWGGHVRSECRGTNPAQSAGKNFFGRAPPLFGSKSTISRFGERFRTGQYTVWSVSCLLFFYSRCPPCPAICKSGGHVPRPCPWSRRHCQRDWAQVRERLPAKTDVLTTERRRQPWITTVVQNLCAFKRLFCVMCHRRRRLRRRVVWSRATVSSWRRCRTFPAPVSTTTPDISTSSSSAKRRPSARFLRLRSFFLSLSFAAVCDLFKHFAILVILYVNVQQISWGLTLTVLGVS